MSTAILIFANTPEVETRSKRFTKSGAHSVEVSIATHLNKRVADLCKKSGIDYYHIDSSQQHGFGFTERLWYAYQTIFDRGYQNVIAVGNDSPGLTSNILQAASLELQNGKIAIGPSDDGGVYLLGFAKENFSREQFFGLEWKSNSLFSSLQQWAADHNLPSFEFPTLGDIDCENDLRRSALKYRADVFIKLLISLIESLVLPFRVQLLYAKPIRVISSSSLKAPPIY